MTERQRYEDFIAVTVSGRNGFGISSISRFDPPQVLRFRSATDGHLTSKQMAEIKDLLKDMENN